MRKVSDQYWADASMGPRLGSRGKKTRRPIATCCGALLQWGHDWGVVERRTSWPSQQKRRSFNGATTGESWKGRFRAPNLGCARIASMGPRLGSRGKGRPPRWTTVAHRRFNGATTGESWKATALRSCRPASRRFNGATTGESWKAPYRRGQRAILAASMGPRLGSRGKPPRSSSTSRAGAWLQWGHDWGVVERSVRMPDASFGSALQWGHDWGVVESPRVRTSAPGGTCATPGERPGTRQTISPSLLGRCSQATHTQDLTASSASRSARITEPLEPKVR